MGMALQSLFPSNMNSFSYYYSLDLFTTGAVIFSDDLNFTMTTAATARMDQLEKVLQQVCH